MFCLGLLSLLVASKFKKFPKFWQKKLLQRSCQHVTGWFWFDDFATSLKRFKKKYF